MNTEFATTPAAPKKRRSRRLGGLLAATALATAVGVPLTATPALAITCYEANDGGSSTWYDGPMSSYRYDQKFGVGPVATPQFVLDNYVPQGLATWSGWDGAGTVLVYTAYSRSAGGRTLVQGVDAATGARTQFAYVATGHAGGIAFAGGYMWIANDGYLDRYSLTALRGAFTGASSSTINPDYRKQVPESSFLGTWGGGLFAGKFHETERQRMTAYRIESGIPIASTTYEVPVKAQGIGVTGTHFFFSTSYDRNNRSNVYVVKRGAGLDTSGASCFRAPSMSEGLSIHNGVLYQLFESGSAAYPGALNVIKRLHQTPLDRLTPLVY